ncbi:MAG: hypothetical protein RL341_2542 [Pseudomonadota bacterium]
MWVDAIFTAASVLAASAWVLLLSGDRWPRAQRVWAGLAVPLLLSVAYAIIFPALYVLAPGGYASIEELVTLLTSDRRIVLAAWLHYLAFDLLIGCYITERSRAIHLSVLSRALALLLTFLFGPAGWLVFQVQMAWRRYATTSLSSDTPKPRG